jgi:hypothetical protein
VAWKQLTPAPLRWSVIDSLIGLTIGKSSPERSVRSNACGLYLEDHHGWRRTFLFTFRQRFGWLSVITEEKKNNVDRSVTHYHIADERPLIIPKTRGMITFFFFLLISLSCSTAKLLLLLFVYFFSQRVVRVNAKAQRSQQHPCKR